MKPRVLVLLLAAAASMSASAERVAEAPVGVPQERPVLDVVSPSQAVMQSVTQLASGRLVAVGERGLIVISDDLGASWRQSQVPVSVTLTAVQFADEQHGWAVGHFGTVLHSADGGLSWQKQLDGVAAAGLVLRETKERIGEPAEDDVESLRALASAQRLVDDGPDKPFFAVHFFDQHHGLVIGAYNLAFETRDGGSSWQPIGMRFDNPGERHLYSLAADGERLLIAGEEGLVFLSENSGAQFSRLETPYEGSFFSAGIVGGDFLVAGLRGQVFATSDAGATWRDLNPQGGPSFVTLDTGASGQALLANAAGRLFRFDAGAPGLQALPPVALPPVTGLLIIDDRASVLTTVRGLVRQQTDASSLALHSVKG